MHSSRMALAERGDLLFFVEDKPIVGLLRPAWLILQSLVKGREGPLAELVEITAADPELGCDL